MKIAYLDKTFRGQSLDIIYTADSICHEYEKAGYSLTQPDLDASPGRGRPGAHDNDIQMALDLHDTIDQAAAWLGITTDSLRIRLKRDGIPVPRRMVTHSRAVA